MKILSFGSLNLDYTYMLDHIVAPGETIASLDRSVHCGGKGLNQSVAMCRAGAQVWHAGKIGPDGGPLKAFLENAGVRTELIETDPSVSSGHAIIQLAAGSGQNSIIICAGTNALIDKAFIRRTADFFEAGDCAVFQNEISNVEYAVKYCKEKDMHVIFNPSPMTKELADSGIYEYVDDLFINETEGKQLTGKTDAEEICRAIEKRWQNCRVILTLGSEGAVVLENGRIIRQNAFPCDAADTTGAGDTFSGYFSALTAAGRTSTEALELASKAASLAVRKKGAAEAIPTLQEVLDTAF